LINFVAEEIITDQCKDNIVSIWVLIRRLWGK